MSHVRYYSDKDGIHILPYDDLCHAEDMVSYLREDIKALKKEISYFSKLAVKEHLRDPESANLTLDILNNLEREKLSLEGEISDRLREIETIKGAPKFCW